ncbi:hypothetical protein SEE436_023270, partial [Salmonella enterica subsp. enterica serovar Enteritidis str. 436]
STALDMILTGKQLRARQALKAGWLMMWCRKLFTGSGCRAG